MTWRVGWLACLLVLGRVAAQAPEWPSEEFKDAFLSITTGDFAVAIVVAVAVGALSLFNGPRRRK